METIFLRGIFHSKSYTYCHYCHKVKYYAVKSYNLCNYINGYEIRMSYTPILHISFHVLKLYSTGVYFYHRHGAR